MNSPGIFKLFMSRKGSLAIVVFWLIAGFGLGSVQPKLQEETKNDTLTYLPESADSSEVLRIQRDRLPAGAVTPALIVFEGKGKKKLSNAQYDDINATLAKIDDAKLKESLPVVAMPTGDSFVRSEDGESVYAVLPLTGEDANKDIIPAVKKTRQILNDELPNSIDFWVTGPAGSASDAVEVFNSIDGPLLLATVVLVGLLLIATYRSPVIWIIPIITVMLAYLAAAGAIYALVEAGKLEVNGQTTAILIVLMFGAGTDYCLLMVSRLREELVKTSDARLAVAAASRATFAPILTSGSTVVAAMLVLMLADLESTATMGPSLALGVSLTMLAAFTLLPAIFSLLGRKVFWPRIPYCDESITEAPLSPRWRAIGEKVKRAPAKALIIGCAVLLIGGAGNLASPDSLGFGDTESFSKPTDSADGFTALKRHFDQGVLAPTTILVKGSADKVAKATPEIAEAAQSVSGVKSAVPSLDPANSTTKGDIATISVVLDSDPYDEEAGHTIDRLRTKVKDVAGDASIKALVGGPTAQIHDTDKTVIRDQNLLVPAVLVLILVIIVLLLRAIVAPLHLILSVVISYFSTLGITLWLFSSVLDHPGVDKGYATYLFIFVVALGVDYNIFLIHRIREEAALRNTVEGAVVGLARTGGVITSAGLILAGTFLVLATMPVYAMQHIGIGVAIGIIIDTFIVRSFIVPAVIMILGERNWWPSRAAKH